MLIPKSFVNYLNYVITFYYFNEDFNEHFTSSNPKIPVRLPNKFLENSGKNLKEFNFGNNISDGTLNLAIAKFCPNLQFLTILIPRGDLETLEEIFINCQQL